MWRKGCFLVFALLLVEAYCQSGSCDMGFEDDLQEGCKDIDECKLINGGCMQNCMNTNGSFMCSCNDGYILDTDAKSCLDIDECQLNNGGCMQNCMNTNGSFMCSCNDGYILDTDAKSCLDIDECQLNNGGCMQNCMNTNGSFMCSCDDGYILDNTDEMSCLDIDECELNNGGCWHNCMNTDGSFMCSCNVGYFLDDIDKMSCIDHNECTNNTDNCEQVCNNHVGGFVCSCYLGCELNTDDMTSCSDIDECLDSDCDQICTNLHCTDGRYNCSCNDGYKLGKDEHSCIDIDECELGIDNCNQTCTNTIGSYECGCQSGCSLNSNNFTCDDIDECIQDVCSQNCDNKFCTEGKYTCSCDPGYELGLDEHTCFDIMECELGMCNQTCTNLDGSFSCGCEAGCILGNDLTSCIDIDECSEGTDLCEQQCSNTYCTNGIGYTCSCNDGYTLDANGYSCSDIDECSVDDHGCEQTCNNTNGSFECGCSSSCRLNIDGKTCSDIDECTIELDSCEHICTNEICSRNTPELDYTCSCYEGFDLNTSNLMTCEDINECATNNGGCTQVCNNTLGSFNCSCNAGYELDQDGFTCNGVSCNDELQAPLDGTILCNGDSTDEICTYSCNQGFYLEGNEQRTCQSNEEWTGVEPQCLKFTCPELEIESSLLLEQCENTVFSVCTVACKEESYVDGVELYYTQTCAIDAEDNTYWVNNNKTCQANSNVCNPNPCQNGGTCQKNTNEDVLCVCGLYSTGLYCETTLLLVPDIPILMVNQESETFSLYTQSHSYITISITTDSSIEVYPSNTIDLSPWDTEVHFSLMPTVEGFFEIEYYVLGITTEKFELPVITHLIVEDTSITSSIFDDYNITDSVLFPGCCVTSEPVQSTYCTVPGQEMRLSSSCGWRDGYATNGITFLHSGDIALPISIISSDTFSSATSTCDECEYDRSETCLSSSATPSDIVDMLKQKSLLNTFLYNIKQVLPSSVTIGSSDTLDTNYATADEFSYTASITSPENLAWIDSCENLGIESDNLVYAIRTNSGMNMYSNDQRFTTVDFTENVCFAVDPCRLPQSPLFMSIPQSIKNSAIQTIHSSYGLSDDTVQDVSSLSLSSFGVLPFPGVERFWNGSSMVNFETSKTFDIGVGLTAGLGEVGSSRINFTGMAYGKLNETISVWLTGRFAVDIYPLFNGRIESMYLSADDNGLFITEQANNSEFQSGASMKLIYDPDSNSGMLTDYIQSTKACLVQTYVNMDDTHNPYYFSLRSQCLTLKTLGLNFPDLTTTIVIPTVDDYWPANPQLAIRALGWNLNSKPTDLGLHLSIPVSLDNAYALQLDLYANHSYSAVLKGANLKILDRVLLVDIQFWDSDLSFSTSMEFYNRYQAWILGSSSFLSSSWDDIVITVNGKFMDSLQTDLDSSVRAFLNYQGQKYNDRVSIAEASINSSAIVMNEYERQVENLTNQFNVLSEEVQNLELKYQSALNYINQNSSLLLNVLLSANEIDQDDLNAVLTQCDILNCGNGDCQFGLVPTTCDTNINNLLIESNEQTYYVSLVKQDIETGILFTCSQQSNCQNYNGIRWLSQGEASIPSPVVDSETALPYSYSSLYCQGVCQTQESTSFIARNNKYEDTVTRNTIQTENISNQLTQVCFMNTTCDARFLDEPCMTRNYDCQDRIFADAVNLAAMNTASLLDTMISLYNAYARAVELAISTRVALDDKVFDMEMTKRKLDMATSAHTSSIENYQTALNVLTELEKEASTIVNSVVSSHTDNDIFSINSITFTLELNSNSSNTLPLMINYSIPFMGESFTITLELDETVPLHITLEMYTRSIVDHLLLNIDNNYATKYGLGNVENLFETNCLIMDEVYLLINHFNDSLLDLENNYKYSNLMLVADLQRLKDRAEATTSLAADLSNGFNKTLITTLYNYNTRVEAEYLILESIINKFLYTHWLEVTDAYSVASVAIGDNNCNSFIDCLKLSIDLMTPIVLNDPTIADAHEQIHTSLTSLRELSEMTSSNARDYISPFLSLLHITKESNYWCASKPNITEHPTPEVYWRMGSTGTLNCEASSEISVAYAWWKDGYVVPNITTAWLNIENIQYSDLGVYTCEAYNDVGSTYSLPSTVRELILPNILTEPDKSLVTYIRNEGGVQLTCEAESDYQYSYHWNWLFKAEGESDYKEIYNLSNALFIESPAVTDEGYYQCMIVSPFGSLTSDYAKLTVADPVVSRIYYPMVIILWDSPSEESSDTNELHHLISDDEEFIELLRNYLKLLAGQNSDISIEDISINSHDDGYHEVTFALSSKNLTSQKIAEQGLSDVLPEMRSIISSLEQGLVEITNNISSVEPFEYGNSIYTVVNTSLIVFNKHFDCPSGYQLDETLLICVPCAQGQYGGVTEVLYRSESHNVYYPVVVPTCMWCPKGYYQGGTGAVQCTRCPDYYTTVDNGAILVEECKALCLPDTYSEDGIHDCQTCSDGSYQPLYGARKCLLCTDVPSDSARCPLPVTPTIGGRTTDTSTLIIATAITGSIVIICFVLIMILILSIGIRKIRRKRVTNESLDNMPSFRNASAFEASSVRKGMPIQESKENDLKIHNPIYVGEADAVPLQQLETFEQKSLRGQEDKTQVTFLDDVDDKSIGEANMSIDDTELLLPPELQGLLDEEKIEVVKYESVGEANMAFEIDMDDFTMQDNEDPISEDQKIASDVVKSAIQSAIHGDSVNDMTPLMAAEEDVSEDEDMIKNAQLTKELEDELATQLPQQLNTTSSQSEDEEEEVVGGLETISEESSTSVHNTADPTSLLISDDKDDAVGSLVVVEQVEDVVVSGEPLDTPMVIPDTNDVEVDKREMPLEEKIHSVNDEVEGDVNESATPNEDKQEEEKAGEEREEMEEVDTAPEPIIETTTNESTADDTNTPDIPAIESAENKNEENEREEKKEEAEKKSVDSDVIRTAAIEESSSEEEEQQQQQVVEQESKEKSEDKPQVDEDKTNGKEELVDMETVIDMGEDETTVTDSSQIPSKEDLYASDTIKGKVEVDEEHEVSADYLLEDEIGKDRKLSEIIADISTDDLEKDNDDKDSYTVI